MSAHRSSHATGEKDTAKSKIGAAKSKRNPQKQFAPRPVPSQLWHALSNEKLAIHIQYMLK
jgi:hypothetical protein